MNAMKLWQSEQGLFREAVSRLQQLPQCATPEKGLNCLVDVCHLVATAAEDIGAPPPSADELVPLITYVRALGIPTRRSCRGAS